MKAKEVHEQVEASKYKPWQIYLLTAAVLSGVGLYLEIGIVTETLRMIEVSLSGWSWLAILGIQGVLIGFVAEFLYEQGDKYAKAASSRFGSKDRTLLFRIGVMTLASGVLTKIVPPALENVTEYLVVQTTGAIIALGILLVHEGTSDWNTRTEWPAIAAGIILAFVPSLF
ncbi:hypothetical protein [Natrinema saccharevitans]|uniref:hypothetical protein n=1 Tax=Natrinema saccharevitans TaxID=301967 RepID=UPI00096F5BA5|nr:hypothetical protein [Natrinema saccharevitans]